jgi:predicted phosphodiesterase
MKLLLTSDLHYNKNNHSILESFFFKIKEENPDIIIIAGDIISSNQYEWEKVFGLLRYIIEKIPVFIIKGNHDFWNESESLKIITYSQLELYQSIILNKYNIHYLQEKAYEDETIKIQGFNGWYKYIPYSNDSNYLINKYDKDCHKFFMKISNDNFYNVLDGVSKKKINILVTHFNCISQFDDESNYKMHGDFSYMDFIKDNFDYLIFGHTHKELDIMVDKCHVLNPGSDYNNPKYKIIGI